MTKYKVTTVVRGHSLELDLQRINVILGGNGTGKSTLLRELKKHKNSFGTPRPVIYVEGGRTMTVPDSLTFEMHNYQQYSTFNSTENKYKEQREHTISQRVKDALLLLEQKEQKINNEFATAANNWNKEGRITQFPAKEQAPLERLFEIFNEIFPSIFLTYDSSNKSLLCKKDGATYATNGLSDGEKQIFCLLADIFMLADKISLIIVDEPELNLNPGLACRFWDVIENELSDSIFIYATHSVSFSMRKHVDTIIVLGKEASSCTSIENISDLDSFQLYELLGAIPAILSSASAIAVEGKENSFDQGFYRWLLGNNDLEVVPVGGCQDVLSVANKTGIWEKIAPSVKIKGIIDCDFRNQEYLKNFNYGATIILENHEVESYLCEPKLICEIATALSVIDPLPSEKEIEDFIFDSFNTQINTIAALRTFSRAHIRLGVSVDKNTLSKISSKEELIAVVSKEAEKEKEKASSIGEDNVVQILNEEYKRCSEAYEKKSLNEVLLLMPGKELLNKLAPKIGCRSERNLLNALKKHINIESYPKLISLRDKINAI